MEGTQKPTSQNGTIDMMEFLMSMMAQNGRNTRESAPEDPPKVAPKPAPGNASVDVLGIFVKVLGDLEKSSQDPTTTALAGFMKGALGSMKEQATKEAGSESTKPATAPSEKPQVPVATAVPAPPKSTGVPVFRKRAHEDDAKTDFALSNRLTQVVNITTPDLQIRAEIFEVLTAVFRFRAPKPWNGFKSMGEAITILDFLLPHLAPSTSSKLAILLQAPLV
jgi:hypothetical protein